MANQGNERGQVKLICSCCHSLPIPNNVFKFNAKGYLLNSRDIMPWENHYKLSLRENWSLNEQLSLTKPKMGNRHVSIYCFWESKQVLILVSMSTNLNYECMIDIFIIVIAPNCWFSQQKAYF